MKSIPLLNTHINLGAKMGSFAGYNMPLYYSSIKEEHLAVRKKAGVFDVSHMGEFIIEGNDAEEFIQYISSNDISKISKGMSQYTVMPNETGGVVVITPEGIGPWNYLWFDLGTGDVIEENYNVTLPVTVSGLPPSQYLIQVEDLGFPGGCSSPVYFDILPPEEILVNDRLTESSSLRPIILYKKMIKMVVEK